MNTKKTYNDRAKWQSKENETKMNAKSVNGRHVTSLVKKILPRRFV